MTTAAERKKAHDEWRESLEEIFVKRMNEEGHDVLPREARYVSDDNMLRMLDRIGWSAAA